METFSASAQASATVANQPGFDLGGFPVKVLQVIAGASPAWETLQDRVEISANVERGQAVELNIQLQITNVVPELEGNSALSPLTTIPEQHTAGRIILALLKHYESALLQLGISGIQLQVTVTKGISIRGTGLGSSGATPAAALKALLRLLLDIGADTAPLSPIEIARLLHDADRGVPDNAIPAYFGGLNLLGFRDETIESLEKIDTAKNFLFVLVTPTTFGIETKRAREVLQGVSRPTESSTLSDQAMSYLKNENVKRYAECTEKAHDWFVTPRSKLYPNHGKVFEDAKASAKNAGAFGVTISGAGPTMIAFVSNAEVGQQVGLAMSAAFQNSNHEAVARLCKIDDQGSFLSFRAQPRNPSPQVLQYHSTRSPSQRISLSQAVLEGLAPDGGLYVPETIPQLSLELLHSWKDLSYQDLCLELAKLWFSDVVPETDLRQMIHDAYTDLEPRLVPIRQLSKVPASRGQLFCLELFHGPTLSFKDFGARFLAQLMSYFASRESKKLTILAATSGDTGVAVAAAFAGVPNIDVVILYPEGKVSPFQESQMLALKGNVKVFAVDGTFDDCQANVKRAFLDPELKAAHLTSANSINIGRLIPQSWYYVWAYLQLSNVTGHISPVFSIPSGNFGNLCACLYAKLMGLPISRIIAATNINDIVPKFLETGIFETRPSVLTLANSMDIGNPSNWERIRYYLGEDYRQVGQTLWGSTKTDADIRATIAKVHQQFGYAMDPHGAVAWSALEEYQALQVEKIPGIAVMTGSPYKYRELLREVMNGATDDSFSIPTEMEESLSVLKVVIPNDYETLKQRLL
jgi:threonine synthase